MSRTRVPADRDRSASRSLTVIWERRGTEGREKKTTLARNNTNTCQDERCSVTSDETRLQIIKSLKVEGNGTSNLLLATQFPSDISDGNHLQFYKYPE